MNLKTVNGLKKLLNADDGRAPHGLRSFIINDYNVAILKNARDACIKDFVSSLRVEIGLTISSKSMKRFSDKYTD